MQFKFVFLLVLSFLVPAANAADPLRADVLNLAVSHLGKPHVIKPVKHGGSIVAVVWEYQKPGGLYGVILIDGKAVCVTVDGQPRYFLAPEVQRAGLDLRIPDTSNI